MSKVVELKTRPAQRSEEVIGLLKSFLEDAERGEIVAIALAGVRRDMSCSTACSGAEHVQPLLGSVVILQHRMLHESVAETETGG